MEGSKCYQDNIKKKNQNNNIEDKSQLVDDVHCLHSRPLSPLWEHL